MSTHWFYSGDIDLQYGGFFYAMRGDYVEAVRVTPCSDAGGPDNLFWLEVLTVNLPTDDAKLRSVLDVCGYSPDAGEYHDSTKTQQKHMLIDACIAYGTYDIDQQYVVQIGAKRDTCCSEPMTHVIADKTLRGNSSLRNFVCREFLRD